MVVDNNRLISLCLKRVYVCVSVSVCILTVLTKEDKIGGRMK